MNRASDILRKHWLKGLIVIAFGIVVAIAHPFFIFSDLEEFDLAQGRLRKWRTLFGVRYNCIQMQDTRFAQLISNSACTNEHDWVLVSQRGFEFPFDIFGKGQHYATPKYSDVPYDLEYFENLRMRNETNSDNVLIAKRYMELLRNGEDIEANRYIHRSVGVSKPGE